MEEIQLTRGFIALVDDEDYEYLNQFKWSAHKHNCNSIYAEKGREPVVRMHRLIMNSPHKLEIDHIDGNGLNNQKSNLRECTRSQKSMNQKPHLNSSSKYKGVYYSKKQKNIKYIYA